MTFLGRRVNYQNTIALITFITAKKSKFPHYKNVLGACKNAFLATSSVATTGVAAE